VLVYVLYKSTFYLYTYLLGQQCTVGSTGEFPVDRQDLWEDGDGKIMVNRTVPGTRFTTVDRLTGSPLTILLNCY